MSKTTPEQSSNSSQGHRPAWMALSLGAISGALVLFILALVNRVNFGFRRSRQQSKSDPEKEVNDGKANSFIPAFPSARGSNSPVDIGKDIKPGNNQQSSGTDFKLKKTEDATSPIPVGNQSDIQPITVGSAAVTVNTVETNESKGWSTPTRYIMGVVLFLVILIVLYIGRSAIPLVVAAALLAVVLDPVIKFFTRRLKYNLAVGLTYFLVVLLLLAIPLLAIPAIVEAVDFFSKINYNLMIEQTEDWIQNIIATLEANPAWAGILVSLEEYLITFLNNFASQLQPSSPGFSLSFGDITSGFGRALGTVTGILGPTFSALVSLFLTILISLQMTLTTNEMKDWTSDLIPPGYRSELTGLITNIRRSWTGFLRGQISLMLVIGVVTWLGGLILGLPGALLLGVIAGVMELIPSVGPVIAAIPAVLLALLFGSTHFAINHLVFALIVVVFYGLVQLLENQLLVPRIMGDAVDLPPLVVLIGIIAGAGAFGIMGALLATPVIATGNLIFRYIYGKIIEAPPLPAPEEDKPGIVENLRSFLSRFRRSGPRDKS